MCEVEHCLNSCDFRCSRSPRFTICCDLQEY